MADNLDGAPPLTDQTALSGSDSGWLDVYLNQPLQLQNGGSDGLVKIHAEGSGALRAVLLFSVNSYPQGELGPSPGHYAAFGFADLGSQTGDDFTLSGAKSLPAGPYRLYLLTTPRTALTLELTLPGLQSGTTDLTPANPLAVTYRALPARTPARWASWRAEAGGTADLASLGMIWQQDTYRWPQATTSSGEGGIEWCDAQEPAGSPDWSGCPSDTDTSPSAGAPTNDQMSGSYTGTWNFSRVAYFQCAGRYQVGTGATEYGGPAPGVEVTGAWIPLDLPNDWAPPIGGTCTSSPTTPPGGPPPPLPPPSSSGPSSTSSPPTSSSGASTQAPPVLASRSIPASLSIARTILDCAGPARCVGSAWLLTGTPTSFVIGPGNSATVKLRIPPKLRARLQQHGRSAATVELQIARAHGHATRRFHVQLKLTS